MMSTGISTQLTLDKFLSQHKITVYNLSKYTKGKLSRTSLYHLVHKPKAVQLKTLDVLIDTLSELTGKTVGYNDLLERTKSN